VPERFRRNAERYLLHPGQQRSIAPVLALTLLTIVSLPFLIHLRWGNIVAVALVGGSAYLALVRTGAHGGFRRAAEAIVVITTVTAAIGPNLTNEDDTITIVSSALFVLLLMITPMVMLVRLLLRPKITVDTMAGALAAYLQIGLFFGALYRFVGLVETQQFFVQGPANGFDYMYFSFITMTTVGYGDFTPATTTGQTLAVLEAIIGQVFLVTVVALIVSNLGRENPRGREDQAEAR
jgi:voltage-gated potassium channel Kch